jgi:hypothetical protein
MVSILQGFFYQSTPSCEVQNQNMFKFKYACVTVVIKMTCAAAQVLIEFPNQTDLKNHHKLDDVLTYSELPISSAHFTNTGLTTC